MSIWAWVISVWPESPDPPGASCTFSHCQTLKGAEPVAEQLPSYQNLLYASLLAGVEHLLATVVAGNGLACYRHITHRRIRHQQVTHLFGKIENPYIVVMDLENFLSQSQVFLRGRNGGYPFLVYFYQALDRCWRFFPALTIGFYPISSIQWSLG